MAPKIAGLARLKRRLDRIPKNVRQSTRQAVGESAESVVKTAKILVPKLDGDLDTSIDWTFGDAPDGAVLTSGKKSARGALIAKEDDIVATVYAGDEKAFYPGFVEFGTEPHNLAAGADRSSTGKKVAQGAQHPGAKAEPFFYPAYRMEKKKAAARIKRAAAKAARAAAKS